LIPFAQAVSALGRVRKEARKAIRDAEACARAARSTRVGPPAKARKGFKDLENAIVEVKKHRSIAESDERSLDRGAPLYDVEDPAQVAEQLRLQGTFVEEIRAALARLDGVVAQMRREDIEERRRVAIADVGEALDRVSAAADRADAVARIIAARGKHDR